MATRQATVAVSVRADRDRLVAEACARIRDGIPALDRDERAHVLRSTVRAGIELFLGAWAERRPLSADELATLETLSDTAVAHDLHPEAVLHAHRIVVEVVREDIARTVAARSCDAAPEDLLRELGHARALEDQVSTEVLSRARELDRRAATQRSRLEQSLVDALLETPVDPEVARDRLRRLGLGMDGCWTVAAATGGPDRLRTALRPVGTSAAVGTWQGTTLVVTTARRAQLTAGLRGHGPAGIARPARDLGDVRRRCEEASAVLAVARRRGGGVVDFDAARLELVLMGALTAAELAAELLTPLDELGDEKRTWILDTLIAYLDAGCSVTAAARRLHLHRESFRYRLQQVTTLFGEHLEDPDRRLALHLAVKAHRLCPATAVPPATAGSGAPMVGRGEGSTHPTANRGDVGGRLGVVGRAGP